MTGSPAVAFCYISFMATSGGQLLEEEARTVSMGVRLDQRSFKIADRGVVLQWPARIKNNVQTWHPAYVADYLPTVLELFGMPHPQPKWVRIVGEHLASIFSAFPCVSTAFQCLERCTALNRRPTGCLCSRSSHRSGPVA